MAFEATGTVVSSKGAVVNFRDGRRAKVFPGLKVMSVTAPDGATCSLTSSKGAPYLASMCAHNETRRLFEEHLGASPWKLLGVDKPVYDSAGRKAPEVESVRLVDRYV